MGSLQYLPFPTGQCGESWTVPEEAHWPHLSGGWGAAVRHGPALGTTPPVAKVRSGVGALGHSSEVDFQ